MELEISEQYYERITQNITPYNRTRRFDRPYWRDTFLRLVGRVICAALVDCGLAARTIGNVSKLYKVYKCVRLVFTVVIVVSKQITHSYFNLYINIQYAQIPRQLFIMSLCCCRVRYKQNLSFVCYETACKLIVNTKRYRVHSVEGNC